MPKYKQTNMSYPEDLWQAWKTRASIETRNIQKTDPNATVSMAEISRKALVAYLTTPLEAEGVLQSDNQPVKSKGGVFDSLQELNRKWVEKTFGTKKDGNVD